MGPPPTTPTRGDATRQALVAAATVAFGRNGFDAASTRAIADAAGVPQGLIGYHFGGKEGLYLAVFDHIADELEGRLRPIKEVVDAALRDAGATRDRHLELLLRMVDTVTLILLRDESGPWAPLIMREQQSPTAAFDLIYTRVFAPMSDLVVRLVRSVRGDEDEASSRLTFVALMAQVIVLRASRATILRQLGWSTLGEGEIAVLRAHVRKSTLAILEPPQPDAAAPPPRTRARAQRARRGNEE